jgi:ankyrin repeat protein
VCDIGLTRARPHYTTAVSPLQGFMDFYARVPRAAPRPRRGFALGYHITAFQAWLRGRLFDEGGFGVIKEDALGDKTYFCRINRMGVKLLVSGLVVLLVAQLGCAEVTYKMQPNWHEKFTWNAEDYFDDPRVIALCHAIEANNLAEINHLVAAGADVNAKGRGNMTPLLWAFPDNKLERFKRLLEHGADPNVIIESDFNTRGGISAGNSVTHMACKTSFPGYFEAVFEHGGDPNLAKETLALGKGESPLFSILKGSASNKMAKAQLLIKKGANLDHQDASGMTPTMTAVGWGGQFDIALALLEAGANHQIYQSNEVQRLAHVVVRQERRFPEFSSQQKADYQKLVRWLEDHGESVEQAKADIKRWDSWSRTSGEFRRKIDAEIAARKAREARENATDGGADVRK